MNPGSVPTSPYLRKVSIQEPDLSIFADLITALQDQTDPIPAAKVGASKNPRINFEKYGFEKLTGYIEAAERAGIIEISFKADVAGMKHRWVLIAEKYRKKNIKFVTPTPYSPYSQVLADLTLPNKSKAPLPPSRKRTVSASGTSMFDGLIELLKAEHTSITIAKVGASKNPKINFEEYGYEKLTGFIEAAERMGVVRLFRKSDGAGSSHLWVELATETSDYHSNQDTSKFQALEEFFASQPRGYKYTPYQMGTYLKGVHERTGFSSNLEYLKAAESANIIRFTINAAGKSVVSLLFKRSGLEPTIVSPSSVLKGKSKFRALELCFAAKPRGCNLTMLQILTELPNEHIKSGFESIELYIRAAANLGLVYIAKDEELGEVLVSLQRPKDESKKNVAQTIDLNVTKRRGAATFIWRYQGCRDVTVKGSWDDWKDEYQLLLQDGLWVYEVDLDIGIYHYEFQVDGNPMVDDSISMFEDEDSCHNILEVLPFDFDVDQVVG